ncbi:SDR family NAD(P)-dependent oxidoreductase [Zwartia vadi]|uniref:SDR family NAD(P)-dependent oxidoreductase n=1 Tax=Zwartia vadi TaxID=3058168 RepID=UPI0025B5A58F|nr:SDR family NAD(P)-dependent oxidoreductase [Zwartia vadi]MDN3987973.1 SDR family NAD(P)-dependent oxidoreductase [Zwartia vadi]
MYSPDLLKGRVALVTGAAGGIGQAVVEAFLQAGAVVVGADLGQQAGLKHDRLFWIPLDVTQSKNIQACVEQAVAAHGRIDILVNVAGVVSAGNAQNLSEKEWDRVIDINLKGTFLMCQAVMPVMKQQKFGRIINLGSVLGKNGGNPRPWIDPSEQDRAGNVAYGVSKAGVHIMTVYLAKELASFGITVNAVAPGPIGSAMTTNFPQVLRDLIPAGRMGKASEVASAILFLAAPDSAFVTGEILDINGGLWSD